MANLSAWEKKKYNVFGFSHNFQPTNPRGDTFPCHEATFLIPMSWLGESLSNKCITGGSDGSSACWVVVETSRLEPVLYSVLLTLEPSASHAFLIVNRSSVWKSAHSFPSLTRVGRGVYSATKLTSADLLYIKNSVENLHIRIREKINLKIHMDLHIQQVIRYPRS